MKLRELTLADAPWCAELEQLLFPGDSPWSVEEFQSEIAHALTKYFGVEISGRLVGYAGMAVLGPPYDVECEIRTIAVDPTYQGRGVGKLFMDAFTRIADAQDAPIFLEVRTTATDLRRLGCGRGIICRLVPMRTLCCGHD